MTIGGKEYEQIIVTDTEGGVLALIDDEDIVEHEDCKVECVPSEAEQKPITWTGEYTRIVVETDEDNPVTVATFTGDDFDTADGYRVRMRPKYD